jgi:hypothetical protein
MRGVDLLVERHACWQVGYFPLHDYEVKDELEREWFRHFQYACLFDKYCCLNFGGEEATAARGHCAVSSHRRVGLCQRITGCFCPSSKAQI